MVALAICTLCGCAEDEVLGRWTELVTSGHENEIVFEDDGTGSLAVHYQLDNNADLTRGDYVLAWTPHEDRTYELDLSCASCAPEAASFAMTCRVRDQPVNEEGLVVSPDAQIIDEAADTEPVLRCDATGSFENYGFLERFERP